MHSSAKVAFISALIGLYFFFTALRSSVIKCTSYLYISHYYHNSFSDFKFIYSAPLRCMSLSVSLCVCLSVSQSLSARVFLLVSLSPSLSLSVSVCLFIIINVSINTMINYIIVIIVLLNKPPLVALVIICKHVKSYPETSIVPSLRCIRCQSMAAYKPNHIHKLQSIGYNSPAVRFYTAQSQEDRQLLYLSICIAPLNSHG